MALGCLVVALMHVIAQETEIPTQITVQPGTTLTFVMQRGKAVPSEVKATLKTVSLPQEPPMTAYKLPRLPLQLQRPLQCQWHTCTGALQLLYLVSCQHCASCIRHSPPRTGADQSCRMPRRGGDVWVSRWCSELTCWYLDPLSPCCSRGRGLQSRTPALF